MVPPPNSSIGSDVALPNRQLSIAIQKRERKKVISLLLLSVP